MRQINRLCELPKRPSSRPCAPASRPSGHRLIDAMPWKYFGRMTDDELRALWLYLRSLPALPQGT